MNCVNSHCKRIIFRLFKNTHSYCTSSAYPVSTGEGHGSRVWEEGKLPLRRVEGCRCWNFMVENLTYLSCENEFFTFVNHEMDVWTALNSLKKNHTPSKHIQIHFQPIPVKHSVQFFLYFLNFEVHWTTTAQYIAFQPHNMMRSLRPISSSKTAHRSGKLSQGLQPGLVYPVLEPSGTWPSLSRPRNCHIT